MQTPTQDAGGPSLRTRTDRPIPRTLSDRAVYASSFIMRFGGRRSPKSFIICSNAPQWVADLMNVAVNEHGIIDQYRQEFIVDALRRIERGRFAGEGRSPNSRQLRSWSTTEVDRTRYLEFGRGEGLNEIEELKLGYLIERIEVFVQVLDHLMSEPYEGLRSFSFMRFQQKIRPDGTSVE